MGYLPNYENDIFVSFAEEDNAHFPNADAGWVDMLCAYLRLLVKPEGNGNVHIQTTIPGNLPPRGMFESLRNSALVLVVLSNSYLKSRWLNDNGSREHLFKLAKEGRLFIARKLTVQDEPVEFQNIRHHEFWYHSNGYPRTCGEPVLTNDQRERYYDTLCGLAYGLSKKLESIKNGHTASPIGGTVGCDSTMTRVFLAEAPPSLEEEREKIRRHLEQFSIDIVPKGIFPKNLKQLQQMSAEYISSCRVFVQLLETGADNPNKENVMRRAKTQLDIAERAIASGLKIMHWRDPDTNIDHIENEIRRAILRKETVYAERLDDFCHSIKMAAMAELPRPAGSFGPIVFVDVERDQLATAKRIFIEHYSDVSWDLMEVKRFKSLKSRLSQVEGVIMFWGEGDGAWTVERYYEFRKRWKALKKQDDRLRIYDGPPPNKPVFAGANFPMIIGRDGGNPEALRLFVKQVVNES